MTFVGKVMQRLSFPVKLMYRSGLHMMENEVNLNSQNVAYIVNRPHKDVHTKEHFFSCSKYTCIFHTGRQTIIFGNEEIKAESKISPCP